MKDGQPHMILGSPGGDDQVMRTIQTLINVIDFGMNVQQAIEAPRWSTRSFPASPFPHAMRPGDLSVEARISEAVQAALPDNWAIYGVVATNVLNLFLRWVTDTRMPLKA